MRIKSSPKTDPKTTHTKRPAKRHACLCPTDSADPSHLLTQRGKRRDTPRRPPTACQALQEAEQVAKQRRTDASANDSTSTSTRTSTAQPDAQNAAILPIMPHNRANSPTIPTAANDDIDAQIDFVTECVKVSQSDMRAKFAKPVEFLRLFRVTGYGKALRAAGIDGVAVQSAALAWPAYNEIFRKLKEIHRAEMAQRVEDNIATVASAEYEDAPDRMRAAALIMPAIDSRYRANAPQMGQAVQINITI